MRLYICPIIVLFVFFCIFIPAVYNYNAITYDVFSPNPLSDAYNPNEALLIMKVVAASYAVNSSTCLEVINKKHGTDFEEVYHKVSYYTFYYVIVSFTIVCTSLGFSLCWPPKRSLYRSRRKISKRSTHHCSF